MLTILVYRTAPLKGAAEAFTQAKTGRGERDRAGRAALEERALHPHPRESPVGNDQQVAPLSGADEERGVGIAQWALTKLSRRSCAEEPGRATVQRRIARCDGSDCARAGACAGRFIAGEGTTASSRADSCRSAPHQEPRRGRRGRGPPLLRGRTWLSPRADASRARYLLRYPLDLADSGEGGHGVPRHGGRSARPGQAQRRWPWRRPARR